MSILSNYENVTSKDAYKILCEEENSYLIDVRTDAEWQFVGFPDLSKAKKEVFFIQWQVLPEMKINEDFALEFEKIGIKDKNSKLFLLCRSGVRSAYAANLLSKKGYENCFNITDGFEGRHDEKGHRGNKEGWKAIKLPWIQK